MNRQTWFWWSSGVPEHYVELWIQMWEYLKITRDLDNLIWVYSVNYWSTPEKEGVYSFARSYEPDVYYPGHEYVDVLGVEVMSEEESKFDQHLHDTLLELGEGKPIAITENDIMPEIRALKETQPAWVYWVTWMGWEEYNSDTTYLINFHEPRALTQDEVELPSCD